MVSNICTYIEPSSLVYHLELLVCKSLLAAARSIYLNCTRSHMHASQAKVYTCIACMYMYIHNNTQVHYTQTHTHVHMHVQLMYAIEIPWWSCDIRKWHVHTYVYTKTCVGILISNQYRLWNTTTQQCMLQWYPQSYNHHCHINIHIPPLPPKNHHHTVQVALV